MILPLLESQDQFLVNFDRIRSILNQSWANFGQKWNFDERKPANSELICSILIEFVQCNEMGDFISLELNSIMIHILSCEYITWYVIIFQIWSYYMSLIMWCIKVLSTVMLNQISFFSCGKKETCRDSVIIVLGKCCDPIGVIASSCWDGITLW